MKRALLVGLGALACQSLSGVSDLEVANLDPDASSASGGSAGSSVSDAGSDSAAGGAGTDAGTGGGPQSCANPEECPGTENDCATRTCTDGECGISFADDGTAVSDQIDGDCQVVVCDGAGQTKQNPDDTDVKDDGNECTLDQCEAGVDKHPFAGPETACGSGTATHCDGSGKCVGCTAKSDCPADTQCSTWACSSGTCAQAFKSSTTPCGSTASCTSGTQTNPDKCSGSGACTDFGTTSCGAYTCGATACNTSCTSAAQCASGHYCGGGTCKPKKADGSTCNTGTECLKGFCVDAAAGTTGVCCDTACAGACEACTSAKTGTAPNGTCAPVANMTDPDNDCPGGRVCLNAGFSGQGGPGCSGINQCDCNTPVAGGPTMSECCGAVGAQCDNCPGSTTLCEQTKNTPCSSSGGIGGLTQGYMGPGWGVSTSDTANCPSSVLCAVWTCECVP